MELAMLNEFIVTITLAFCLCVGYMIKTSLDFVDNKYIPLIMGLTGMIFNVFVATEFNGMTIVAGLVTGLASTGMYELFRNFIEKK